MNDGDPISGFFTLNTAGQTPGSFVDSFGTNLLVDYGILAGTVEVNKSTAAAVRFFGSFGGSLDMFGNFALFIANELSPNMGAGAAIYGGSVPYVNPPDAGFDISCDDAVCGGYNGTNTGASLDPASAPLTGTEVPLPAGVWLLAGGLGVLGVLSRRKRR